MGQGLHKRARTTQATRRDIQASQEGLIKDHFLNGAQ